jgi:hypothetical protein
VTPRTRFAATGAILFACLAGLGAQEKGAQEKEKKESLKHLSSDDRMATIRHAQVWLPTDIPSLDIKAGPQDVKAFAPGETVTCDYVPRKVVSTPKFWCEVDPGPPKDVVKVKYGEANGEVYGEVAATRLLWALGFGADRMYPVKVLCRGCSADPITDQHQRPGERLFDPASIERLMPGKVIEHGANSGWSWGDLAFVDQTNGGAPLAHRDALKLLAVFMQHTDSKPAQQRLICLDGVLGGTEKSSDGTCGHPFMMLNDVGRTFGKANMFNRDEPGSVDLKAWSSISIWKDRTGCVANMPKSMTGTLEYPHISDGGRKFLAGLLGQLSDAQIHDLFDVARVTRRQPGTTVEDWVNTFKHKRDEITTRSCNS